MKGAVTGVFSYSGRFIAEALLARGWEVVALGRRRPAPADSLAERVDFYPLLLDDEDGLVAALSGCEVLFNTYASADSPFPYFRGKAAVEDALRRADCAYAILRPTLIFGGREEVPVNHFADEASMRDSARRRLRG
jgi:NADH dehydrogenase